MERKGSVRFWNPKKCLS